MTQMLTIPTVWPYFAGLFGLHWLVSTLRQRQAAKQFGVPFLPFVILTAGLSTVLLWLRRSELPRVYRRVKLSEDEPYGREEEDIALFA
ncbi:hypothetical protein [Acetobacter malorum]|uniref:hypothetical protein n=1 Tax=Acetobacter malorum TaxID=178901 RepID=UPI001E42F6AF|nr:hypothetical protein [Acetobacter malorum]